MPIPNHHGTDTADQFGLSLNAALLPEPLDRFPRLPQRRRLRDRWIGKVAVPVGGLLLIGLTAVFVYDKHGDRAPTATSTLVPAAISTLHVVIGSANFPENSILAEIYAEALEAKGVHVTRKFSIGNRDEYLPGVHSGGLTIVPEYNGQLLSARDGGSTARSTKDVDRVLSAKLPPGLEILDPAPAQDQDNLTVTKSVAAAYGLTSIRDLTRFAGGWVIGAQSEFKNRSQGGRGLRARYGLNFKRFQTLQAGPDPVNQLQNGSVQVADVFTTDPGFEYGNLKRLTDPEGVFKVDNVVPLVVRADVDPVVVNTLNAVSHRLTQTDLVEMNRENLQNLSYAVIARSWFTKVGLV